VAGEELKAAAAASTARYLVLQRPHRMLLFIMAAKSAADVL
jgi:hypothetical protein